MTGIAPRRTAAPALVLALVLAACGGTSDGAAPGGTASSSDEAAPAGGTGDAESSDGDPAQPAPTGTPGPVDLVDATVELGIDQALLGVRGHAVAAADVDGDGWTDLFVGTFADREPETYQVRGADGPAPDRLLLGSADGFRLDPDFEGRLGRTAGALFADLDDDGDPDLVVSRNVRDGERQDAPSEIYRNDDGRLVPATVLDDHRGGRALAVIDLDRDGLGDLVQVEDRWSGRSTALHHNDGELRFHEVGEEAGFPDGVWGLGAAVGDLDGDGVDDLVIGGSNRWFLGDGEGGLTEGEGSPLPWELHGDEDDPAHVTLFDADGDGRLDVLIGQHFNSTVDVGRPEPVRLYRNDAGDDGPVFTDVTDQVDLAPLGTKSPLVLAADLDLDGVTELVATASGPSDDDGPGPPVVLSDLHQGDGLPAYSEPGATGPHYWIDAVTLDADRDGRTDLFFVEWEPAVGSRLYLNPAGSGGG